MAFAPAVHFLPNFFTESRGEANSKLTLVHSLSNVKEYVQFERKYMKILMYILIIFCFYHGRHALGKANMASPLMKRHLTESVALSLGSFYLGTRVQK
jgi:hypothetical protein